MKNIARLAAWGSAFAAATSALPSLANDVDIIDGNIPVVLTPTRLRQSLADVPASVTIITSEMISKYGIRSIPDALRLVPGMAVTQITGNDYRINYHGTNILVPRRMNVLLDGMSVYGLHISRVDWRLLPAAIEDIERIEITRGSNSAAYGSNSMLAVINVITKHPHEVEGTTLSATAGSLNTATGMVRYGGTLGEATAYRITFERDTDGGFDYASTLGVGHDSKRINRLNFRSITDLAFNETLDFQASFLQGIVEAEFVDSSQRSFPDVNVQNYSVNATWRKSVSANHAIQLQAYATNGDSKQRWRSCLPAAYLLPQVAALGRSNPNYAKTVLAGRIPSGGTQQDDILAASALAAIRSLGTGARTPICADANQDYEERRYDVELQDTYVFSDKVRMVNGIGLRYDYADSETYFGGKVSNATWRTFTNLEYKPLPAMSINAGGFLEKDNLTGSGFSPRIALNTHLNPNNTIRFVVSKAVRMPNIIEQKANWTYRTTNYSSPLNGATDGYFALTATSPGNLHGEKILSKEIGYLGNFPQHGVLIDAKIFDDQLTDLISEKLQNSDFRPTNNNWIRLRGLELQVTYTPTDRCALHFAYSNLHNDTSNSFEQTQYAKHSGALGLTHTGKNGWRHSLSLYKQGADSQGQSFYGREDLTISKLYRLGKDKTFTPSFTISHLDNRSSTFLVDVGRIRESRYNSTMQYFATLKLTF